MNNDGIIELLLCIKPFKLRFYQVINDKFNPFKEVDFQKDLTKNSKYREIDIRVIKLIKENLIALGTNLGLFIYKFDQKFNFKLIKSCCSDYSIWVLKNLSMTNLIEDLLIVGFENGILILDNNFIQIHTVDIKERVYQIELFDIDDCGFAEIIISTQKGKLYIYKINSKNKKFYDLTEIFCKELILLKECSDKTGHNAINTLYIEDIDQNGKINILIGGHDTKIKIYEWIKEQNKLINIYEYEEPINEVYCIKIIKDEQNNTFLLYSTYQEAIALNSLIFYFGINNDFIKKKIKSIAEGLQQKPNEYCFFLGAGFSHNEKKSHLSAPLARDLISEIFDKYEFSEKDLPILDWKESLEFVLYHLKKQNKGLDVKQFIKDKFDRNLSKPISVKILTDLVRKKIIKQILTVNFDLLIENELNNEINIIYKNGDFIPKNIKNSFYVKLHGSCEEIDSIVASIDEIESNKDAVPLLLKRNLLKFFYDSCNFIFIGYSFNDEDLIDIFKKETINNDKNIYIINPNPNKHMNFIIENRIKNLEIQKKFYHIFKCKADEFFLELIKNFHDIEKRSDFLKKKFKKLLKILNKQL